jgi:NTP pyrophosphatase (non-canonical NTP hydrolase)
MALEETAELQKEVCKIFRGDWSSNRMDFLAEEIADVRLMLEQLEYMFGITGKIEIEQNIKLIRLQRLVSPQVKG